MGIRNGSVQLIYAVSTNNVMGSDNSIPWRCKADFKYFKQTTEGHVVVMGRKTWESLPTKPLPNRVNVVVSRQPGYAVEGAIVVSSLEEALLIEPDKTKFVIGGQSLLERAAKVAYKAHITEIGQVVISNWATTVFGPDLSRISKHMVKAQSLPIVEGDTCVSAFAKVYLLK